MEDEAVNSFMAQAVEEARRGMDNGTGGPFGALVIKDGKVIASAHNMVLKTNDPTAHAEVLAIRAASRVLGTHDLSGCALVTTSEPCPMCLGAIMWARIDQVYYGTDRNGVSQAGFADKHMYEAMNGGLRQMVNMEQKDGKETRRLMDDWMSVEDRRGY